MLPDGRRLGAHMPLGDGMVKAVERAREIGASAMQIFGDNPTAWRRRAQPPREQPAFRAKLVEHDIGPVSIHAAYLINLAGTDDDFFEKSVEMLSHDLAAAPGFAARFVNVHTGSHRGAGVPAGAERVADGVARVVAAIGSDRAATDEFGAGPAMLILENSSGGGAGIGATVEELALIAEAAARRGVQEDRLGFCIDAAHAWGAGYDMSRPDRIDELLLRFDELIGIRRLPMIHLNDSKSELGSRTDRHEHVGAGRIGEVGMAHLLRHPLLGHAAYYVETPGMDEGYDAINVARAKALAAGEPLEPLPPGAFELRGSRSRSAPAPDDPDDVDADPRAGRPIRRRQPTPA